MSTRCSPVLRYYQLAWDITGRGGTATKTDLCFYFCLVGPSTWLQQKLGFWLQVLLKDHPMWTLSRPTLTLCGFKSKRANPSLWLRVAWTLLSPSQTKPFNSIQQPGLVIDTALFICLLHKWWSRWNHQSDTIPYAGVFSSPLSCY